MKILVSDNDILSLEKNKSTLLMRYGRLYVLCDFEITEEEKTKKSLFGKTKKYTKKYLTSATVLGYHTTGDFIGVLDDNATERFLVYNDLYELRKKFVEFKKMLNAFSFTIEKIKQ